MKFLGYDTPTHVLVNNRAAKEGGEFLALTFSPKQRYQYGDSCVGLTKLRGCSPFDAMKQVNDWILLLLNERQVESGPPCYWDLAKVFSAQDVCRLRPSTPGQRKAWSPEALKENIPIGVCYVVKVQVPILTTETAPMALVYDEFRTFDAQFPVDDTLLKVMDGEPKCYFEAVYSGDGVIDLRARVESQPW